MDRNNGRYTYIRRGQGQGQQHQNQNHHYSQQHQSNPSSSSSSASSSLSSTSNNYDNHRNSSMSSNSTASTNTQYSTNAPTNNSNNTTAYVPPQVAAMSREPLTPHDELIRYIREAWTKVSEQGTPVFACNESDHQLKNFKPFNLEEYWGQRLVQNIHVAHGHQ